MKKYEPTLVRGGGCMVRSAGSLDIILKLMTYESSRNRSLDVQSQFFSHIPIGYEPAGLTVHPPKMIAGGFIFFVWVSSVTKIFSSKKKWIL